MNEQQLLQMWNRLRKNLHNFKRLSFERFKVKHNSDQIFAEMCHLIAFRLFTDRVIDQDVNAKHMAKFDLELMDKKPVNFKDKRIVRFLNEHPEKINKHPEATIVVPISKRNKEEK